MKGLKVLIPLFGVLATIIVGISSNRALYDVNNFGAIPKKTLAADVTAPLDPLFIFSGSGQKPFSMTLKFGDETIDNVKTALATLHNTSSAPILPSEIFQNLSLKVNPPWRIVAVADTWPNLPAYVGFQWTRVNDSEFEAKPALLNPGDRVSVGVYLTNPLHVPGTEDAIQPKIEWGGRIANLTAFGKDVNFITTEKGRRWGIIVNLEGWGTIYMIVSFAIFEILYLALFFRAHILTPWSWISFAATIGSMLLSMAAAEASATYLFGSLMTDITGVSVLLNMPWIVLNSACLIGLGMHGSPRWRRRLKAWFGRA